MKTRVLDADETLEALLAGSKKLYDTVSVTMGPRSRNVIFKKENIGVGVTHDGVTVTKVFKSDDEPEDIAATLLRQAAMTLDSATGDGTTTVTVLAYHIFKNAVEQIKKGHNAMLLKTELEILGEKVVKEIEALADSEVTLEVTQQIATTAAGDKLIGEEIGKLVFEAGHETPIVLERSEDSETRSEVITGYKIDSGAASPYLLDGLRAELMESYVAVIDAKMRDKEDIVPLLELIATLPPEQRSILFVVDDIAADSLTLAVLNRVKRVANIAVARVPQTVQSPADYLMDIAIATGAQVMSRDVNPITEPLVKWLGKAKKVIVEPGSTIIVGGHADPEELSTHMEALQEIVDDNKNAVTTKFAQERLDGLNQQLVNVRVGGQSESEAQERHYRFEDAIGASQAALRHGVVPGGGTVLYSIGKRLGDEVLAPALMAPMQVVLESIGVEFTPDSELGKQIQVGMGMDVMNPGDKIVNLVDRGIIDPAESEIESVKTAISIASLLMTSGAMIVDEENKDEADKS